MATSSNALANRILTGLVIGLVAGVLTLGLGSFFPQVLSGAQVVSVNVLDPLGQIFLRLLFFVVVPLVFASLAAGVLQLGSLSRLGPLAVRTFSLFSLNMVIAVALGLLMMNVLNPGGHIEPETKQRLMAGFAGAAQQHVATSASQPGFTAMTLVEMFMPRNLLGAVAGPSPDRLGAVLPLILFAILTGAAGTSLAASRRQGLQQALETVVELMTGIVHFALRLAPYAVLAMIYSVIVKAGMDIVIALGVFMFGCAGVMLFHLFGTMSLWLKLWTKRSPREFFSQIKDVIITAFSTSSSAATLPAALRCAKENLGASPGIAGFVLPLGSTMNMSGTALYEGCVVLFVAQVFGVELSYGQQLTLLILSVLSAVAVAGIPGGSLPLIAGLLATFGIPPEGIGIVLGVDRLLDMTRTTTNVGCDLVTVAVVEQMMAGREAPAVEPPGSSL